MDKAVKLNAWEETSYLMTSRFEDFDGDLQKWCNSFYEVWRHQMTWGFAYEIEVIDSRANGVFLSIRVKPSFKSHAEEMLEMLGYKNVSVEEEKIGVIESYDVPEGWWYVGLE